MGTIRFLLALSVLITHSSPLWGRGLLNGDMAVICFFVISGFLMTMILETRYSERIGIYLKNRLLRVYPPYFAALLFAAAVFYFFPNGHHNPYGSLESLLRADNYELFIGAIVANLTLFGAEMSRYINVTAASEILFPNFMYRGQGSGAHNFLFVPQAWTLPLELMFYFLAPFVVRLRTRWIFSVTVIVGVIYYLAWGYSRRKNIPFESAAFFPFQLVYFMLGSLAYRAMKRLERAMAVTDNFWIRSLPGVSFIIAVILVFTAYDGLRLFGLAEQYLYVAFAACVPGMFIFGRSVAFDEVVGEYSYPVYLFHYPIAKVASSFVPQNLEGWFTLVVTLIISALYIFLIDRRVERVRRVLAS